MRRAPLDLLIFAGFVGCATVDSTPSSSPDASAPADATTGADSAPPADAALPDTAPPPVDGSTKDAGVDAADSAGPPTFCDSVTPKPTFCADFDKGKPVDDGFTRLQLDVGATAQLGLVARSAPYSFNAITSAIVDGQFLHVLLVESIPKAGASASLAFSVRLAKAYAIGPNTHITLGRIRFPAVAAGPLYLVELGIYGGQGQIVETTVPNGQPPQYVMHNCAFVTAGTFVRVQLDVTLSPTAKTTLTYDGAVQLDTAITPPIASGNATVEIGLDVGSQLESVNASFDDIVVVVP